MFAGGQMDGVRPARETSIRAPQRAPYLCARVSIHRNDQHDRRGSLEYFTQVPYVTRTHRHWCYWSTDAWLDWLNAQTVTIES